MVFALFCQAALAQPEVVSAPLPGSVSQGYEAAASVPGAMPAVAPSRTQASRGLPLSYDDAARRLEELRNLMPNSPAKEFQTAVNNYLEWLADMSDAHWRIHQSFAKLDGFKGQAEKEKQTTLKLGQLKRQAMLLKAEFLIREHRQAEALGPLVDIVTAEAKTANGQTAYELLKSIGFCEEAPTEAEPSIASETPAPVAVSVPAKVPVPAKVSTPAPKTKAVPKALKRTAGRR